MQRTLALALTLTSSLAFGATTRAAPTSLPTPHIFAPGVISGPANDGSPTFSPDGNTLYFTRSGAGGGVIMESHRVSGHWSTPKIAPFSGAWPELAPQLAPDGSYLLFVALRPPTNANGKKPHRVAHLWRVDRIGAGWDHWSKPRELPATVNISNAVWKASIAANGDIYFLSIDHGKGKRLYVSHYRDGGYHKAQPLPFSHYADGDVDPEIAADGSFMVFASSKRLKGDDNDHLFIVFRDGKGWGTPEPIHYAGERLHGYSADYLPHLGPDQRTVYFASNRVTKVAPYPHSPTQAKAYLDRFTGWDNGNNNAWSLSLTALIDGHRKAAAKAHAVGGS